MSDRYQLHLSIVYAKAVMISTKAVCGMQVHSTHAAPEVRLPSPLPSATAVSAVAFVTVMFGPMADKGLVHSRRGRRLHVGEIRRVGGCYLRQQMLSAVQDAALLVRLQAPQLVGVANARIE